MKKYNFLWLDAILDEKTVKSFSSISPASNFWQKGFVNGLQKVGHNVHAIGFPVERLWPFGRFTVSKQEAELDQSIKGLVVGYLNLPFLKNFIQTQLLFRVTKTYLEQVKIFPDYVITYSCKVKPTDVSPATRVAMHLQKKQGIPWICIVADGIAPEGADAYVYLTWQYQQLRQSQTPSIHIDGGIAEVVAKRDPSESAQSKKVFMYMGALTEHGGALELVNAFSHIDDQDIELWICGRGSNNELERIAELDKRVSLYGFVDEKRLNELASMADFFVNPRPTNFEPNKLNYPSKLLHYLAYGKPVISTFTDGLSPEYNEILLPITNDSVEGIAMSLQAALSIDNEEYVDKVEAVIRFNTTHSWTYQMTKFTTWISEKLR